MSEVQTLKAELKAAHAHIAALIALLKPVAPPVLPNAPPRERSEIEVAIKEEAGADPKLRAWFRKRVKELRAEGKSDGDIVLAIRSWESTEASTTED